MQQLLLLLPTMINIYIHSSRDRQAVNMLNITTITGYVLSVVCVLALVCDLHRVPTSQKFYVNHIGEFIIKLIAIVFIVGHTYAMGLAIDKV